jgi:hypothetical protein
MGEKQIAILNYLLNLSDTTESSTDTSLDPATPQPAQPTQRITNRKTSLQSSQLPTHG